MKKIIFIMLIALNIPVSAQSIIEITVKGISDSKKDGAQQDRLEAITDAKRQACEKAGLRLESKTTVENFKAVFDYVETQSQGILLPGFQIIEVGYVEDGTYQVVLSGKIKKIEEDNISSKELRYAKSLNDRGNARECIDILQKYMDSKDESVSEELKEQSLYYLIKWGYAQNITELYEKFAAYYPQSKYLNTLKSFSEFTAKPLYELDKKYTLKKSKWDNKKYVHEDMAFDKQIHVEQDTILLKDFKNNLHSIVVDYTYFLNTDENAKNPRAQRMILTYYPADIKKGGKKNQPLPESKIIEDELRTYAKGSSNDFQFYGSEKWFGYFKLSNYSLKGTFPTGTGEYEQSVRFTISQRSF